MTIEKQLIEKAKESKQNMFILKDALVKLQLFEFACELREIEKQTFPETEEITNAKNVADKLSKVFKMFDLNVPSSTAWLINEVLKTYNINNDLSIKQATDILEQMDKIFN